MNYQKLQTDLLDYAGIKLTISDLEKVVKLITEIHQPDIPALPNYNLIDETRLKVTTAVLSGMMSNNGITSMASNNEKICEKSIELTDELLKQLSQ